MNKTTVVFSTLILVLLAGIVAFTIWGVPYFFRPLAITSTENGFGSDFARAQVTQIIEEGTINMSGHEQSYQVMMVKLQEGQYDGIPMQIDYGKRELRPNGIHFQTGDEIYVTTGKGPDNVLKAYYVDYDRTKELWILVGVFVIAMIIVGRWKGVGSVVGLIFSIVVIMGYVTFRTFFPGRTRCRSA